MSMRSRLAIVLLLIAALAIGIYVAVQDRERKMRQSDDENTSKETIVLWYTDDALTDYLNSVALAYYEETDVRVKIELVSGLEYLEKVSDVSVKNGEYPDLYIVGNDSLGRAYLSGIACEVQDASGILSTDNFSQTALHAISYNEKKVAYPMYFETSFLVFNETYLKELATAAVEKDWPVPVPSEEETQEAEVAEEEAGEEEEFEEESEETENPLYSDPEFQAAVIEQEYAMIPATIDDILSIANDYDAPGNVEAFLRWDVSDIFYNYFFVGSYLNLGGSNGDNPGRVNIYNEDTISCMMVYQALNQFFSIDANAITYQSVMQDFMDGKVLFTIATSDAIAMLEAAKEEGTFAYEYGVATIPNLTKDLNGRSVSMTSAIAINGYSNKKAEANAFAKYLSMDYADSIYPRTGKMAAFANTEYENEALYLIMEQYAQSVPMPKVVETGNFWVYLELAFTNIWLGDDANTTLKNLSEQIMKQITGEDYQEEPIEVNFRYVTGEEGSGEYTEGYSEQ